MTILLVQTNLSSRPERSDLRFSSPCLQTSPKALRYLIKREVRGVRTTLIPPQLENATITERDKFAPADAELARGRVDPFTRPLELRINTQRRFVDHAMALLVRPF